MDICFKIFTLLFLLPCSARIYHSANPKSTTTKQTFQYKDAAVWALSCNYIVLVEFLKHVALISVRIEHHHVFSQLS